MKEQVNQLHIQLRRNNLFHAEIRKDYQGGYFAALIDRDGTEQFKGAAQNRKQNIIKRLKSWFPLLEIIDTTK